MSPSIRARALASLLALVAALVLARPADAAPAEDGLSTPDLLEREVGRGRLSRARADLYLAYALGDHSKLPSAYRSDAPWDGTLPLLELRGRLDRAPKSRDRDLARSELEGADSSAACSTSTEVLHQVTLTDRFAIDHGDLAAGLALTDYSDALETSWETEIEAFGWWAPPVKTSNPPPGGRYHVRLAALSPGLYGYVSRSGAHAGLVTDNPASPWNDADAYASCMVLSNDYGWTPDPLAALRATAAHELNHSIQFGIGVLTGTNKPDSIFIEGGATWMEDEVFDDADDNHDFLWPTFSMNMGHYTKSPYRYWVILRAMTERYGAGAAGGGEDVMQTFWEKVSRATTKNMFPAMNAALVARGTTLADAYHRAAVALKFNTACDGAGFSYPYCLEEGPAYVARRGATSVHASIGAVGGAFAGVIQDNYALAWVVLPPTGPYDVSLKNTSSGGKIRASVACASASGLSVGPLPAVATAGVTTTLAGFDPTGCDQVVAVVTNQTQTGPNPGSTTSRGYRVSVSG